MNELAQLSASERQRLVDDFVIDTFGDVPDDSGIGERMRQATPALPDHPSPEQVAAWIEVAAMVQDNDFRGRIRQMVEAGRHQGADQPFDGDAGRSFAATVSEHVDPAMANGVDPSSDDAGTILERILPDADPAERTALAERLETFTDERVDRYWRLVGTINGWPTTASSTPTFLWLIEALRAHRQ